MEILTLIFSLLILFASSCLYYYVFRSRHKENGLKSDYPLPPGSKGWPIIGETLDYIRTARNGVPEKFLNDRRNKYSSHQASSPSAAGNSCKVFKTSLIGQSVAILCTAAGNKFLFSNEKKLVKVWWPSIFEKLFPNSHKEDYLAELIHKRNDLTPFLKPDSLRKFVGIMDQVTKQHFDTHWSSSASNEKQVIKVHSLAKKYTFTLACKIFLDIEDPQVIAKMEEHMQHITAGMGSMPIDLPGTKFRRAIREVTLMEKEIMSLILQRKRDLMSMNLMEHAPQDLMSRWLMETDSNGEERTDIDMANSLFGPLTGAYESIAGTVCSIMMFLSQLPQVYDAVFKEQMEIADSKAAGELLNWEDIRKMKYTWNVACEVLRLQPPSSGNFREATTDFVYEGYLIPKGMKLQWNVFATHKNQEYFPNPEKFDPSRFEGEGPPPYSYVPFGGGPRMCPGKEYARLEILVFMHNLVTRFKWEKVFPDEKMVMNPLAAPTKGLPIRLYPH